MKKFILFAVISFSFYLLPSCDNDKKDKADKEVAASSLPAAVQSSFNAKYAGAEDTKWETAHENDKETYKAKFKLNGKKMKAEFDTTGAFIKENEDD